MDATTIDNYIDILVKIAALLGGGWGVYKFVQYRELKQRIQLGGCRINRVNRLA